ncbi:MAG: carbohydrate porin, partial [Alphaproteobacteria bacterium]|nr:carbohydrate porin [Alphaproteobacteria bacterium]
STVTWVKSKNLTFRIGVFDGEAGDRAKPHAFFAERLKPSDGLFVIGQTDWQLTRNSRLEAGAWGYTARQQGPAGAEAPDRGAYVSYEAPLHVLPQLSFWLRAGAANGRAQTIGGYIGGGLVKQGLLSERPDDRAGLAIAHAIIGDPAAMALGLPHAETSIEATYQFKVSRNFVVQPDIDYVHHPAGQLGQRDGLGLGLRLVLAGGYPKRMAATDAGDPTIPPDGAPSPSDDNSG